MEVDIILLALTCASEPGPRTRWEGGACLEPIGLLLNFTRIELL